MTGERMRELRQAARLLQKEVGAELGVHAETVCRWETGRSPIGKLESEAFMRLVTDEERVEELRGGRRERRQAEKVERRERKLGPEEWD